MSSFITISQSSDQAIDVKDQRSIIHNVSLLIEFAKPAQKIANFSQARRVGLVLVFFSVLNTSGVEASGTHDFCPENASSTGAIFVPSQVSTLELQYTSSTHPQNNDICKDWA